MTETRKLVHVYPSLFRSHGDYGNLRILKYRAEARGLSVDIEVVEPGRRLPAADFYLVGGGEDRDLAPAAKILREEGTLGWAASDQRAILAVGAGFRISGNTFLDESGSQHQGLGILPVACFNADLATGAVVTRPTSRERGDHFDLPALSGYEHHHGRASVVGGGKPLASLDVGVGNGGAPPADGAVHRHVVGTWMFGPVLARNPELADVFLSWIFGIEDLAEFRDPFAEEVRRVRIGEAKA